MGFAVAGKRAYDSGAKREETGEHSLLDQTPPSFQGDLSIGRPPCAQEHPPLLEQWRHTHDRERTIEGYEKKQGIDHELIPCTHFGEEVSGEQQGHVDTDEVSPGHGLLALRSG